jgi:nitroreductase
MGMSPGMERCELPIRDASCSRERRFCSARSLINQELHEPPPIYCIWVRSLSHSHVITDGNGFVIDFAHLSVSPQHLARPRRTSFSSDFVKEAFSNQKAAMGISDLPYETISVKCCCARFLLKGKVSHVGAAHRHSDVHQSHILRLNFTCCFHNPRCFHLIEPRASQVDAERHSKVDNDDSSQRQQAVPQTNQMSNLQGPRPQSVSETISQRHSIHSFHPNRAVPHEVLEDVFSRAQNSASNSNIQPWEVKIITGAKLLAIHDRLVSTFRSGRVMELRPTPSKFMSRVEKMGSVLYGSETGFGIARDDKAARMDAIAFNFRNYDAPCLALFCIDTSLVETPADVASVGIYLENVILLLWERGLGSIPQASIGGYPDVFRDEVGLSEDLVIVCGLGIGYPDEKAPVSAMRMPKNEWREHVTFFE